MSRNRDHPLRIVYQSVDALGEYIDSYIDSADRILNESISDDTKLGLSDQLDLSRR
jgi:hypothetical protein